jgi:hypothetical protein
MAASDVQNGWACHGSDIANTFSYVFCRGGLLCFNALRDVAWSASMHSMPIFWFGGGVAVTVIIVIERSPVHFGSQGFSGWFECFQ